MQFSTTDGGGQPEQPATHHNEVKAISFADNLSLSAELVTQTQAILGKRGKGKSYAAHVQAEEMVRLGLPFVAIDGVGVWWGLRADGRGPGLDVLVLGGLHGDVPILPSHGDAVGRMIVETRRPTVIDTSEMATADAVKFSTAVLDRLYRENTAALHVFLEEADMLCPQQASSTAESLSLNAVDRLVRRGRSRGLGCTLISQRPQVVHKNVLSQTELLVCMGFTAPEDIKAVTKWAQSHGATKAQLADFVAALPTLSRGAAWASSPGWLQFFGPVQVHQKQTLDASSTPAARPGELRAPVKLTSVGLDIVRAKLAAVVKEVEDTDPAKLRARVRELEGRLESQAAAGGKPLQQLESEWSGDKGFVAGVHGAPPAEGQTIKWMDGWRQGRKLREHFKRGRELLTQRVNEISDVISDVSKSLDVDRSALAQVQVYLARLMNDAGRPETSPDATPHPAAATTLPADGEPGSEAWKLQQIRNLKGTDIPASGTARQRPVKYSVGGPDVKDGRYPADLPPGCRRILHWTHAAALMRPDANQVRTLSKMAKGSGTFDQYLGRMRRDGWVAVEKSGLIQDGSIRLGPKGIAWAKRCAIPVIQSHEGAVRAWSEALGSGPARLLAKILERPSGGWKVADLSAAAGFAEGSGTFGQYLGRLRRAGVVDTRKGHAEPNRQALLMGNPVGGR